MAKIQTRLDELKVINKEQIESFKDGKRVASERARCKTAEGLRKKPVNSVSLYTLQNT